MTGIVAHLQESSRVIAPGGVCLSQQDLYALASRTRSEWGQRVAGSKVAVRLVSSVCFIASLAALDGFASALLLVPSGLSVQATASLLRSGQVDYLVTDQTENYGLPLLPPPSQAVSPVRVDLRQTHATQWFLATSGTTREPRFVGQASGNLSRTVRRDRNTSAQTWGLLYDHARFAGIQVIFQALLGGGTLVVDDSGRGLAEQASFFASRSVDSLSATPTLWRKLLMTPEASALALRQITIGGEIADQPLIDALGHLWPQARITHIYASTEAGVCLSVSDKREGFPAQWLGASTPGGIGLSITPHHTLRVGDWDSGDVVRVAGDRCLFLGRSDGVINVGGLKVHPSEVERVLLEHPGVLAAQVLPKKSSVAGQLVQAVLTLREPLQDLSAIRRELRVHCSARLPSHAVPAFVTFAADVPTTPAGKMPRPLC